MDEPRYWAMMSNDDPKNLGGWYGVCDEEEGGIIAYAVTQDIAEQTARALNRDEGRENDGGN